MEGLERFYRSSIGKKIVVALTGVILVLFLLGHMLGNLQTFEGAHKINAYAKLLRVEPLFLWAIRLGLLAAAVLHIVTTVALTRQNRAARGTGYAVKKHKVATLASRTMIVGGLFLAAFIVYHILHFTTGTVHHHLFEQYGHADVYSRVAASFKNPLIVAVYVLAQVFLFFHLKHGIASLVESLGLSHSGYLGWVRKGGPVLALLLVLGFLSVPLSILFGLVN